MTRRKFSKHPLNRFRLRVNELERRDVPAFFEVTMLSAFSGDAGDTLASHSGELHFDTLTGGSGSFVTVQATDSVEAIRNYLMGEIDVTYLDHNWEYPFSTLTAGREVSDHMPYLVTVEGETGTVALEDITGWADDPMTGQKYCDWDYNDRTWTLTVLEIPDPNGGGGSGGGGDGGTGGGTGGGGGGGGGGGTGGPSIPVVSIGSLGEPAEDGPTPGQFTFSRSGGDISQPLSVSYSISGTATPGSDYNTLGGLVTFPAGITSLQVELMPVDDEDEEPLEDVIATLLPGNYTIDPLFTTATLNIADNDGPIIVMTYDIGIPVDNKLGLKVAKWSEAFELNAAGTGVVIKGPDATTHLDFIDNDPDRFNVWVRHKALWNNQTQHITAKISTSNVPGFTMYNDDASEIDLVRFVGTEKGPGWYWSDSQILVSNEVDDLFSSPTYLGADEAKVGDPGLIKHGYTWQVSDRTHRVALRGTVTASYNAGIATIATEAPVPMKADKSVVKIHATILNDKAGGTPVISTEAANLIIHNANEQYAQVGILLLPSIHIKDPPVGVNLLDGLTEFTVTDGKIALTIEEKALFDGKDAAGMAIRSPGSDDIELYFVNYLAPANDNSGEAVIESGLSAPDSKYADSIVVAMDKLTWNVVAHEIGHVLLDSSAHYYSAMGKTHLMYFKALANDVYGPKRLSILDQSNMYTKRTALLSSL